MAGEWVIRESGARLCRCPDRIDWSWVIVVQLLFRMHWDVYWYSWVFNTLIHDGDTLLVMQWSQSSEEIRIVGAAHICNRECDGMLGS